MLIYIILFSFIALLSYGEQIIKKKFLFEFRILLFIILIFFAALRPVGGDRDYESYLFSFDLFLEPSDYFKHFTDWAFFDPMYYMIPSFYKTYISQVNYSVLSFFTFAIIAISLKFKAISRISNFFFLSVFVYFSNYYLLHEMTQIRAGVATGFFLFALYYLEKKLLLSYFFLILIASMFHYSSIIYFFIPFLKPDIFNKKIYLGILALTLLFTVVNMGFVISFLNFDLGPLTIRTTNHIELTEFGIAEKINKHNVLFLTSFAITAFMVYFIDIIREKNKYACLLIKIQVWGLLLFQFFSSIPAIAFRFSELFYV